MFAAQKKNSGAGADRRKSIPNKGLRVLCNYSRIVLTSDDTNV